MTEWSAALAQQLLTRHGVVTRETVTAEAVAGGFSAVYAVFKAMEEAGRIRRGYFVAGLGGAQFAMPAAVDLLRSFRDAPQESRRAIVAATDPANPYGAIVKWPLDDARGKASGSAEDAQAPPEEDGRGASRSVGARVILVDGFAAGYLRRGERELLLAAPEAEPQRSRTIRGVARALLEVATAREPGRQGMLIAEINGTPAATHPDAQVFVHEGFATTAMGLQARIVPHYGRAEVSEVTAGTGIAGGRHGGLLMADARRRSDSTGDTLESEHDAIRSSNDHDQEAEREGFQTEHNRGYDDAVRGRSDAEEDDLGDVDPDSAESDVDRDDTVDE
jgi:hypothetical protein